MRLIVLTFFALKSPAKASPGALLAVLDDQFKLFPGQARTTMHLCRAQSGAGSPWGSAGAGSSASLLSDSTELTAMQQDGSPTEGHQPQGAAQPVEQQQQQQTVQQQGGASQQISAEQGPQQLQPVPEAAAAAASANDAQRRQAHVPGQVHVTLKVLKRR